MVVSGWQLCPEKDQVSRENGCLRFMELVWSQVSEKGEKFIYSFVEKSFNRDETNGIL